MALKTVLAKPELGIKVITYLGNAADKQIDITTVLQRENVGTYGSLLHLAQQAYEKSDRWCLNYAS